MLSNLTRNPTSASLRERLILALTMALVLSGLGCVLFYTGRNVNLYASAGILVFAAFALTVCAHPHARLRLGPPGLLLLAFLAWNALSVSWSSVPYISMIDVGLIATGAATFVIWRLWNSRAELLPTLFLLVALGVGLSAIMIAQQLAGFRPRAMFLNPNSAAGFLNIIWPFAAIVWLNVTGSPRARYFALIVGFVMVTALALDGSRGAMLGMVAALTLLAIVGLFVLRERRATFILIAVCAAAFASANLIGHSAAGTGAASLAAPAEAGATRFVIWQAAWEMIQQHPWLGYGPGVFWLAYSGYRAPGDHSFGYYVHNDYLEFWIETGLPGLLIAVCLGAATLWLFVQGIRRYRADELSAPDLRLATACFAAIASVAGHSLFTFNLQQMPFLFVLGIVLAELERSTGGMAVAAPRVPSMRRLVPAIGLAALMVLAVGHYTRTAVSVAYVQEGTAHMQRREYTEASADFSTARMLWSQLDTAWSMHANVLLEAMRDNDHATTAQRRTLVEHATTMLDRAEQYNPYRSLTPLIRGLLRADHPDLTSGSPKEALRKALALNPREIEAWYALSQLYEREGDHAQALRIAQEGLAVIQQNRKMNADILQKRVRELTDTNASDEPPSDKTTIRVDPTPTDR